jgi:hypothetical protein
MPRDIEKAILTQQWVHSHEEDTDTDMVFRPATFSFPRSRGRTSFTLEPDGGLVEIGIGPTDRREERRGTWKLEPKEMLAFYGEPGTKPKRILKIISVDNDKLVVRRQ